MEQIRTPPEIRLEPVTNRFEHLAFGSLIVLAREGEGDTWRATIRILRPDGSRYLGGGHRIVLRPLEYGSTPVVVAGLRRGFVTVDELERVPYALRFVPADAGIDASVRVNAALRPSTFNPVRQRRLYRSADGRVQLGVEDDATGSTVSIDAASPPASGSVTLWIRGARHRVNLNQHAAGYQGKLEVGFHIGDDLYVE